MAILDHNGSPIVNLNTKEHVSKSVYLNSPEFNALRKEMFENWEDTYFARHGWKMAFQPDMFCADMCADLGLIFLGFDSGKEAEICLRFLNALRAKRGVSEL